MATQGRTSATRTGRFDAPRERTPRALPQRAEPGRAVAPCATAPRAGGLAVKRVVDFVAALGLVLLVAPVLLILAALVKWSSPGPVLYRQRRIGRDGRTFDILKFRSMAAVSPREGFHPASGAAPGGVEGPDRRTRVGRVLRRTSLDELPQLFNVLRGEMSLVGPRPERPEFVQLFADEVPGYADRHRMHVGITGLAQVRGLRGQTSIELRAAADNEYIERWSLLLDLRVLLLTARAVLDPAE